MNCPNGLADFSVQRWISPNLGSPDYYNVCAVETMADVGVPQNGYGWQYPKTGNAYVGIFSNAYPDSDVREYIQCELTSELEFGERYVVEFFVSRTDSAGKAPDNVGALLSTNAVFSNGIGFLPYIPQVTNSPSQTLTDDIDWLQIIDTIQANGGEKFLTIGVFNEHTNWIQVDGVIVDDAVLYVDDVSVIKVFEAVLIPNVFSPNGDGINDELVISTSGFSDRELSVYNRWGRLIYSEIGTQFSWNGKIENVDAADGVYYILISTQASNNKKVMKKGFVHLLR